MGKLPTWRDYTPGDPDVCAWCGVHGDNAEHRPSCPLVTDMWPIMPHHVECVECHTCCALCGHVYAIGEYMTRVPSDDDIMVCVPCALTRHDEEWLYE